MKVLWFEVSQPSNYIDEGSVIAGWQDSLERLVKKYTDIQLTVAFASDKTQPRKIVEGVEYIPIPLNYSKLERLRARYNCYVENEKLLNPAVSLINEIKPDVIHVFGVEWCWGLVAEYTNIPVVIHIMGSMISYANAQFPPNYNKSTVFSKLFPQIIPIVKTYMDVVYNRSRMKREREIWNVVDSYMGRTHWDYALSEILSPKRKYFHVDEALRPIFLSCSNIWKCPTRKLKLVSTGCRTFWKGPDMLLKTAKILCNYGVDFEWVVVGNMPAHIKRITEKKEKCKYNNCNVILEGFKTPEQLIDILRSSTLYVHTAYIENSPNSICEAQCVGVPVLSTNVGGIETLVSHNVDGILVPANDPWQMADAILSLSCDKNKMIEFSRSAFVKAKERHKEQNIIASLKDCYLNLL